MIRRNLAVTVLTTLLAMGGLAFVVRAALSADDDSRTADRTVTGHKTAEAEIWALEQAYWQFNRDANHEGIISTWRDKFLGWPDAEPRPETARHGRGPLFDGQVDRPIRLSLCQSIIAHASYRYPAMLRGTFHAVNSLMYNFAKYPTTLRGPIKADIIGNYYKQGLNTLIFCFGAETEGLEEGPETDASSQEDAEKAGVERSLSHTDLARLLRPDHPRLFLNEEMWPAMKARALGEGRSTYEGMKREADKLPPLNAIKSRNWGDSLPSAAFVYRSMRTTPKRIFACLPNASSWCWSVWLRWLLVSR